MNKSLKLVFNILIVIASLCILIILSMIKDEAARNANKEERNDMSSFEYYVKHQSSCKYPKILKNPDLPQNT